VAAATTAVGVLDQRTGRVRRLIVVPDTYVYTVTAISASGIPAVVVPGTTLTVYSRVSGAVWCVLLRRGGIWRGARGRVQRRAHRQGRDRDGGDHARSKERAVPDEALASRP